MGRFQNTTTGVVVSVDDSKDTRYSEGVSGFEPASSGQDKPAKKAASSKSDK